jgi:hypothetical protein
MRGHPGPLTIVGMPAGRGANRFLARSSGMHAQTQRRSMRASATPAQTVGAFYRTQAQQIMA